MEKFQYYTQNEWKRLENTLKKSGKDWKLHSKRVEKIKFSKTFKLFKVTYTNYTHSQLTFTETIHEDRHI